MYRKNIPFFLIETIFLVRDPRQTFCIFSADSISCGDHDLQSKIKHQIHEKAHDFLKKISKFYKSCFQQKIMAEAFRNI